MQLTLALLCLLGAGSPLNVDAWLKDLPGQTSAATAPVMTTVDGLRVLQRSCTSSRPPVELRDHFAGLFSKAGLYLPPEQDGWMPQAGLQISGLDPENLISYTALLQPAGKGTTVVIAVTDVGLQRSTPPQDVFAPLFPGATGVTGFNLETTKALSYAAPASPAEIKAFYKETLPGLGYREREPMVFVKGTQQLTITVAPGITERYVMLRLETVAPAVKK